MPQANERFVQSMTAAEAIKAKGVETPTLGLILGSGLGSYADSFQQKTVIPYSEIPHFPVSSVEGHEGSLVIGKIHGVDAVAMKGRVHGYEGHAPATVAFPVRVLWQLGVRTLIVTNAAGGVNEELEAGDLVAIRDHINFTGGNPLVGRNEKKFGPRFPDLSKLWTPRLRQLAHDCAADQGVSLKDGVYAGVLGPNYETPAEVRMLRTLGADVVGMSTVYEAIVAGHMGLDLLGISCVTNLAAGVGDSVLDHDDVQAVAARAHKKFSSLVDSIVQQIAEDE